MDAQKVDLFMMTNNKYFPESQLPMIRERLLAADESRTLMVQSIQFKDPTTALVISLFLGTYGIDRFYIGDTGLGVGKLLTCGGCGIWAIVDWFLIMDATREKNLTKLRMAL